MKVLILSSAPWNTDNSFGNTYSNLFEGMDNMEFANVYCSYGLPKNNINGTYFQITEKSLLKNLVNAKNKTGRTVEPDIDGELTQPEMNNINNIKKKRWRIFFWIRRFIWYVGQWKSEELENFVLDFNPDVLFVPLYHSTYLNEIILYIHKITGVKMVTYVSDDVYSMRRLSFNPFFWLDRLAHRKMIKKVVDECEFIYTISDLQKREYEKTFNKKCKILTKGINITDEKCDIKKDIKLPLKLVYTGNIGSGRWKSLSLISRALERMNNKEKKAELYIYTATPITKKMRTALNSEGNTFLMGSVPSEKIDKIQNDADILIHVESTNLKDRLEVRHSLSTKIVDYFKRSRCILAVGNDDVASIDYLKKNDVALVAQNIAEIEKHLISLANNSNLLKKYSIKARIFAVENHDSNNIQQELYRSLLALSESKQDKKL